MRSLAKEGLCLKGAGAMSYDYMDVDTGIMDLMDTPS